MVGVGLHSPVLYQFDISFDEKTEAHGGKRNLQRLYSWGIGTHIFWVQIQYLSAVLVWMHLWSQIAVQTVQKWVT